MNNYAWWDYRRRLLLRRKKLAAALVVILLSEGVPSSKRSLWIHKYLLKRKDKGVHHNLFLELKFEDPERYRRCLRMDASCFEELVVKVTPLIQKQDTHMRESIPTDERLSVTLRHLATGETQESLSLTFRIGRSTISGIIRETVSAVVNVLKDEFLKFPDSANEWRAIAADFGERWNFHHCVGAMDGKHCLIDPPIQSGSMFYNYKGHYSIVLLAVVDAHLRFVYVDVGTNGRVSDAGVWNKCSLKSHLEGNMLNMPPPAALPGTHEEFPFVIVGDEGFPLTEKVLIPYPGPQCTGRKDRRIFNYRLSRARRCSENAFGVMGSRFHIFRSAMRYDPPVAKDIVLAACCLHNMLRSKAIGRALYTPPDYIDQENLMSGAVQPGDWRGDPALGLRSLGSVGGNRHARCALNLRDRWCQYFNTVGAVEWQERMIG